MDRRISGRRAALSLIVVGVFVGAGCSSDKPSAHLATPSTTTVVGSSASVTTGAADAVTTSTSAGTSPGGSTSAPTPTYVPPKAGPGTSPTRPATGGCQANDTALANAVVIYARANQPTVPVKVGAIRHARSDSAWARVTVTPASADTLDGFVAVAHCVGSQWRIIDVGTSGVGCTAEVPAVVKAEISLEC